MFYNKLQPRLFPLLVSMFFNLSFTQAEPQIQQNKLKQHTYYAPYFCKQKPIWSKDKEHIEKAYKSTIVLTNTYPNQEPTTKQLKAANELQQQTWDAIIKNGWHDIKKANADGFRNLPIDLLHHGNPDFLQDGETLNPEKPEYLIYYKADGLYKIAGAMFLQNDIDDVGPQIGGNSTIWHYHIMQKKRCLLKDITFSIGASKEECIKQGGSMTSRTHEMLHVWFVNHPEGRFGTMMYFDSKNLEYLTPFDQDIIKNK